MTDRATSDPVLFTGSHATTPTSWGQKSQRALPFINPGNVLLSNEEALESWVLHRETSILYGFQVRRSTRILVIQVTKHPRSPTEPYLCTWWRQAWPVYLHKWTASQQTELTLTDTLFKVWFQQSSLQQKYLILTDEKWKQNLHHVEEIIKCF